ncbi:MAG: vWA domain-containing protein [Clostridiaceae bacterium]
MQTTVAPGYLPPSDRDIQTAADQAGLKIKAPEFIRDVCNLRAGGEFVSAEQLQRNIDADLGRYPIVCESKKFKRTDITTRNVYGTYREARAAFDQDRKQVATQIRSTVESMNALDIPGGSPMTQAVQMLRLLAEQQNQNQDQGDRSENSLLKELLSKQNLDKAKENIEQARQLTDKEKDLLQKVAALQKKAQNGESPPPPQDGSSAGTYGKGMSDCSVTGPTAAATQLMSNAILISDKQLGEVIRISRKLKAISKLRTAKVTQFVPDVEGDQVRNRQMQNFNEITRMKSTQFSQMTSMPKIFNYRAVTQQHMIRERGKFVEKKQLLYVLVDCSGSMREDSGRRINLAAGILVNRLMAVADGDAEVFWRFFDTVSHEVTFVKNPVEAHESITKVLQTEQYDGGGTNFDVAISDAVQHIESLRETMEFAKPEIFMVTDGSCSCNLTVKDMKGIKLHSAIVADENSRQLQALTENTGGAFLKFD